ncbi:hypothetical protein EIP91_000354 [Steccherinum ochraceum]|uniref:Uncharacterized protein n=1 Tax=Steccherinum ochraceum TaxID=92696 RepID=A0A4R0RMH5_9APHY|nr:hypothetical protein EIP91_000354 [Steccherinum ochraceum]
MHFVATLVSLFACLSIVALAVPLSIVDSSVHTRRSGLPSGTGPDNAGEPSLLEKRVRYMRKAGGQRDPINTADPLDGDKYDAPKVPEREEPAEHYKEQKTPNLIPLNTQQPAHVPLSTGEKKVANELLTPEALKKIANGV